MKQLLLTLNQWWNLIKIRFRQILIDLWPNLAKRTSTAQGKPELSPEAVKLLLSLHLQEIEEEDVAQQSNKSE